MSIYTFPRAPMGTAWKKSPSDGTYVAEGQATIFCESPGKSGDRCQDVELGGSNDHVYTQHHEDCPSFRAGSLVQRFDDGQAWALI